MSIIFLKNIFVIVVCFGIFSCFFFFVDIFL